MSAASAARRVAPDLEVVVCEAGGFAAYGMCGIPYFLGGVVPRAESLLAYPPGEFRGQRGIDLRLNTRVDAIDARTRRVHLSGEGGTGPPGYDLLALASGGLTAVVDGDEVGTDLVVVATGVRPATDLLIRAGARHLADRSVVVDASMRTSVPDVFAVGDCVALPHLVLGRPAWVPLGPAANKTGRVAGTVAAGGTASFAGVVGTAGGKGFDLGVA